MKKFERKDKNQKRRLAFEKRNVKKEMNLARYGAEGGSALIVAKTGDFNRRFMAAFMALVFAVSFLVVGFSFVGRAEDPVPAQTSDDNSNLVLEKTLSAESNGTYTLQLSAYAKGKIKDVNEQIPTDYVLIADQSGSMSTNDVPTGYNNGTTKNWKVSDGANAYYYKETDANGVDHYYRVYRKYGDMYEVEKKIDSGEINIIPTAYIRGISLKKSIVIVTEAQNLDVYTLKTIIQRCENDCKLIIEGDMIEQKDTNVTQVGMKRFSEVFGGNDCVGIVKLKSNYRSKISELADNM